MSGRDFRVRAGALEDLAAIIAVERSASEAPHWPLGEYAAILEEQSGRVRRCLFVAERNGNLAGFAVGKMIAAEGPAELESVVVDVNARRVGVGVALCLTVAAWSGGQGAAQLELEVRAGSTDAIALYQGLGFVEVGRRRAYYDAPVDDALLMRMELSGG